MTAIGRPLRAIPSWQVTLGLALLGLGFLVAAQLAAEGPRVRYTTQERSPLVETATHAAGAAGRPEGADPRRCVRRSRRSSSRARAPPRVVRELNDRLQAARIAAGLIPLTGTGIVLQLEDSPEPVAPGGNDADYLVGAARPARRSSRSCGRPAPRRSR